MSKNKKEEICEVSAVLLKISNSKWELQLLIPPINISWEIILEFFKKITS